MHMARTPGTLPPSFSTQKNRCPSEYAHNSLRSLIYIHIYIYIYILKKIIRAPLMKLFRAKTGGGSIFLFWDRAKVWHDPGLLV